MLQHCSMKEGSVRCGQKGPWGKGRCCPAPLGSYLPSSRASEEEEKEGQRGALNGQWYCLHRPLMRAGRQEVARGPRPTRAGAGVDGVLGTRSRDQWGRGQRPRVNSRAPGWCPHDQGGDPAPQIGAD